MNKLLAAAALALTCGLSQAGTVTLLPANFSITETTPTTSNGGFLFSSSFSLAARQQVQISLRGWSASQSDLKFSGLTLSQGAQSISLDADTDFGTATLGTETTGTGRRAVTLYTQTFSLDPLTLGAGEWTVNVSGRDDLVKQLSGITLTAAASAAVSEPGALALALLALVPMLGLRRSSRKSA